MENKITFDGQEILCDSWEGTLKKEPITEWPILIWYIDQYIIPVGEWGLTPKTYSSISALNKSRTTGKMFYANRQLEDTEPCLLLSNGGYIPGIYRTTINGDVVQTFAIMGSEEELNTLDEATAIEWLKK